MSRLEDYEYLRQNVSSGKWAERILAELAYLFELSATEDHAFDADLFPMIDRLRKEYEQCGAITKDMALSAENELLPLSAAAKKYDVICAAHAHIDMNWLWGYHETAALTVDTFRTVLKLMDEYPSFTFSQSQASTYRILEKHYPELLAQIRRRVSEGRWELTASSWVENDKNLPSAEAMVQQLVCTKQYLHSLFDVAEDAVTLDFEPDTFGHCAELPEILQKGGIDYYYHCRGDLQEDIFNWQAPSGASVLVYREPAWYNQTISPELFFSVPSFCKNHHITSYLKVYGVGDHGGGPTRRDLDRLIEMSFWPLFPNIHFGTIKSFFEKLGAVKSQFPTLSKELNYVFTGCYTSQSRIKRANRVGEQALVNAATYSAMAQQLCPDYKAANDLTPAWQNVLFNQFHDILPGSGITETREYAMGIFQEAMATAGIHTNHALFSICKNLDTSFAANDASGDTAFGSGVGFGLADEYGYRVAAAERGNGTSRVYTVFNPTQYDRTEVTTITVWDWPCEAERIQVLNEKGSILPAQIMQAGTQFWGHRFVKVAVLISVPAFGYASIQVCKKEAEHVAMPIFAEPRQDTMCDAPFVLENQKLRAVFRCDSMELISLVDKQSGIEFVRENGCTFRLITEKYPSNTASSENTADMNAWRIGKYAKIENLSQTCAIGVIEPQRGRLTQSVSYQLKFCDSMASVTVSLDENASSLRFDLSVDWREFGSHTRGVPQLNFYMPLSEKVNESYCSTVLGIQKRPSAAHDVPCHGLIAAKQHNKALALLADSKYGFRCDGEGLSVALIRSSHFPDATPEIGTHTVSLLLALTEPEETELLAVRERFLVPMTAQSVPVQEGSLACCGQLLSVKNAIVTALAPAKDGGILIRLYNPSDTPQTAKLQCAFPVRSAQLVSLTEKPLSQYAFAEQNVVTHELCPYSLCSIRIQ